MAVSARARARSVRFMGEPMMIVILVDHTGWVRYTWSEDGDRRVERGGWREEGGERRVERGGWREEGGEMGQGGLILLSSSLCMYMYLHEWGEVLLHQQHTVHILKQTQTNITTNTSKHQSQQTQANITTNTNKHKQTLQQTSQQTPQRCSPPPASLYLPYVELTKFLGSAKNSARKSLRTHGFSSEEHRITCLRLSV